MKCGNWKRVLAFAGALGLSAIGTTANAVPVQWTLSGVVTGLGNSITGSFVFDADTNLYSKVSLVTSGGTWVPSTTWTYVVTNTISPSNSTFLQVVNAPASQTNLTGEDTFFMAFQNALTNTGGTVNMGYMAEGTCDVAGCWRLNTYPGPGITGNDTKAIGAFIGVPVAAVPEPETYGMMLAGLGVLVCLATRRNRKS